MTARRIPRAWSILAMALVLVVGLAVPAVAGTTSPSGEFDPWSDLIADTDLSGALDLSEYDPATFEGSLYNVARRIGIVAGNGNQLDPTGAGVQIALIDTGVVDVPRLRHSNVTIGPDFSFEDAAEQFRARDTNGHGTHLAGIMVAADAAWTGGDTARTPQRVLGVAPDAGLVSIKVAAADGGVDVSQVIAAINWVIEHHDDPGNNIRVINLAFGTDGTQDYRLDPLSHAVERAWHEGIVVVVAAGNDGAESGLMRNPAINPYVIAVGASQLSDRGREAPTAFSNDGTEDRSVDFIAPGKSLVSLRNPGSYSDQFNEAGRIGNDLVRGSGTSQAAAVVSGAAAVLLQARPDLTPDEVKALFMRTANRTDGDDDNAGAGSLDLDAALRANTPWHSAQDWERSTGTGSLDLARGSVRVADAGVILEGEIDIFGHSYSDSAWAEDSWSGNQWSGNQWSGNQWSGNEWSGNQWSGNQWSGSSWAGNQWSGNQWSGNQWSGNQWSGNQWSGNQWSGNQWSGNQWSGGEASGPAGGGTMALALSEPTMTSDDAVSPNVEWSDCMWR